MKRPALTFSKDQQLSQPSLTGLLAAYEEHWARLEKTHQKEFLGFLDSLPESDQEHILIPTLMKRVQGGLNASQIIFLKHCVQKRSYLKLLQKWLVKQESQPQELQLLLQSILTYLRALSKCKKENQKKLSFCLSFLGLMGQAVSGLSQPPFHAIFLEIISVLYSHLTQLGFYDLFNLVSLLGENTFKSEESSNLLRKILNRYGAFLMNSSFARYQNKDSGNLAVAVCALNFEYFFLFEDLQLSLVCRSFRSFFYRDPETSRAFLIDFTQCLPKTILHSHLFLFLMSYLLKSASMIRQKKFAFLLADPLKSYATHEVIQSSYPKLSAQLQQTSQDLAEFCQKRDSNYKYLENLGSELHSMAYESRQSETSQKKYKKERKAFEEEIRSSFSEILLTSTLEFDRK